MKRNILIFIAYLQLSAFCFAAPSYINIEFFDKFNDLYLKNYIYKAIENNHSLKEAKAKVERYRYKVRENLADEFPELTTSPSYLGTHFPTGDSNIFIKRNSFILPFSVSWEADLLLKNKDSIESSKFIYKAELANQKGIYLSLLSDVASTYFNILLHDYLIEKQANILKNKKKNLNYETLKNKYGISDILNLNKEKEMYKNEKDYFDKLVKIQKNSLYNFSILIGESAENCDDVKRGKIEEIEYQENIPDIIASELIYNRPDLIEAENRLKSADIDIRKAKKDFFPKFNIMALMFFDTAGGNFFNWDSSFAFLLAGISQDLFSGGRKIANLKIKKAKFKELFENYKQKDLNAIKEVSCALNIIKQDKELEQNSKEKLILERENLNIAKNKLKFGIISKYDYFNNEIKLNQKEQAFANLKTARLIDYVTLYKTLGGGL